MNPTSTFQNVSVPELSALWLPLPVPPREDPAGGKTRVPSRRRIRVYFEDQAWQPAVRMVPFPPK